MPEVAHTFSVVVNTTDRAASLHTLLRALEHQSYPHFEVVVVVGPTRDNTASVLAQYGGRVRVLQCPVANVSVSRNLGLQAALGEIVAYIDDDAVPARNWLLQLNRLFADPGVAASGGSVYLVHPNHAAVQHQIGIISALAEQHDVRRDLLDKLPPDGAGRLWTLRMMGANMAYRRQPLLTVGGFDEFYEWVYDDSDLAMRLAAAGFFIQPAMEACVYHVPASSRNRVAYTNRGRWWIQTKAAVYFAIRNGRAAGVPWKVILHRVGSFVVGHWLSHLKMFHHGQVSFWQLLVMSVREVQACSLGAWAALLRPAALLARPATQPDEREPAVHLFLGQKSDMTPTIDPVSGRQPAVVLDEPPLRVALLSHCYPPEHYEGVGRQTNLMAKGLFELGHTVHVLTHGRQAGVSYYDGAYVHRVPYRLDRYLHLRHLCKVHHLLNYSHAVFERLQRLLLNDDIQLADTPVWQLDGFVTAVSGLLPMVVRPQTAQRQIGQIERRLDEDTLLIGEMEETLLRQADFIAANSDATTRVLQSVYGLVPGNAPIQVIPHGIEPVSETETRPFRLAAPPPTLTVLYVGRLEKRKGILDLFAAIAAVRRQVANVRFVMAGADNSSSDGFRRKTGMDYRTYFAKTYPECVAQVSFLGSVSEEKLRSLYQSCDLFVAPSVYESFGLIYLEAMNYAKPVIGCRAGGIPEVVEEGVCGRLVDPQSPKQLAEALVTLLRSPTLLHDYGVAGRQRLLDRFTHLQMARGFVQIYRQVLAHQATTAG